MIMAETGVARRRIDTWFRILGIAPRIHARVAGNEAIVAMVALGFGVGVVPRIVLDNSPQAARVRVLEVTPPLAPYEVGLVTLRRHLSDPLVAALWMLAPEGAAAADGTGPPPPGPGADRVTDRPGSSALPAPLSLESLGASGQRHAATESRELLACRLASTCVRAGDRVSTGFARCDRLVIVQVAR